MTLVATAAYGQLAGWGLPVQRAFVMAAVMLLAMLLKRHLTLFTRFQLALIAVVIFDPLATLGQGFWLSFGVVFALLAGLGGRVYSRASPGSRLKITLSAQWVAWLSLLPLLGFVHFQLPLAAWLVNLVAIPWVSFLVVPLMLLGLLLLAVNGAIGLMVLQAVGQLTEMLWWFLGFSAAAGPLLQTPTVSIGSLLIALAGAALLLMPRGLLPRWPGLLMLLVLLAPVRRTDSELVVTFLDVGQGLSVLLQTTHTNLIYDTGPVFGERFSAARQIVVPALRKTGRSVLDVLMVSHGDNDHAGGLRDIMSLVPVAQRYLPGQCQAAWEVDGVRFTQFSVMASGAEWSSNNRSCLLLVETGHHRILLTGDIETEAEIHLLDRIAAPVSLISVPHHGSRSSSAPAFLNRLIPGIAVVSAGHRNRFGHPDARVLSRYRARHSRIFNTATSGAVRIRFKGAGYEIEEARIQRPAIWRRRTSG